MNRLPFFAKATFFLLFLILLFYILVVARNFLYPLFLAVLFSYLLYPVADYLEKKFLPRILANLVSIIFGIVVLAIFIILLSNQLSVFFEDAPELQRRALNNLDKIVEWVESRFGISATAQKAWIKEKLNDFFYAGGAFFRTFFTATAGTIAKIGLLPVYVFFMLYYRDKFREFILHVVPHNLHDKTHKIIEEVSGIMRKYMVGISIVVFILCFTNSVGLLIVGLDYAILFGIISAVFNFIPYFGTLIGGAFPFTFALLMMDSPKYAIGVLILFLIIQFTENNILTPNIVGGNVKLNPFITILAIIVGGMVWGIPGMFISVPFLAMFKVFCDYFEPLKPYGYLLGTEGTEKHALTLEKIRFWIDRKKQ